VAAGTLASVGTACAIPRTAASPAADQTVVVESVEEPMVLDSTVTPFNEKFLLTQTDSIVIRCDTIRYRRVPSASSRTRSGTTRRASPPSTSTGGGHSGHASHASHASHSSHSSGGWV
jgi:hypothetical protein